MPAERAKHNGHANIEACPYCKGTGEAASSPAVRFRALRDAHGLTQDSMATKIGISRAQVANLEAGRGDPSIALLMRTSDEFKVTVDWLLGRAPQEGK